MEDRILIVDDSTLMCDRLESSFKALGFSDVTKTHSGQQAIAHHQNAIIDLTFLDIEMPGVDGLQTLRKIMALNPAAYVVMVSGKSTINNVRAAISSGAKGFIVKPINQTKLQEAVDKYLFNGDEKKHPPSDDTIVLEKPSD